MTASRRGATPAAYRPTGQPGPDNGKNTQSFDEKTQPEINSTAAIFQEGCVYFREGRPRWCWIIPRFSSYGTVQISRTILDRGMKIGLFVGGVCHRR